MTTAPALLEVRDLTVEFSTRRGVVKAVQHVDIAVAKGETLAIVGEFGLGQVGHLVRGDAHPRPRRPHRRGLGDASAGSTSPAPTRPRCAICAGGKSR